LTTLRLCVWSGPRNVSTALMYSFAQRDDTRVVDEPLYAHYLRVTGIEHPDREAILASQDPDGDRVVRQLVLGPWDREIVFFKMMAHHLVALDRGFLPRVANVLLVRDPTEMLVSLAKVLPSPRLADTGLAEQVQLFDALCAAGAEPPVLDSREVLTDPRGVLSQLCQRLGTAFDERMLSWHAGPRAEDGVWATHWYAQVHRSTGFEPWRARTEPLPESLLSLHEQCRPLYERLMERAIRARPAA
jgi:hypothetical protein